jgi:hypothetical protein
MVFNFNDFELKYQICDNLRLQMNSPVRIWVRIDPPNPLVCRKRRLNGVGLRLRLENRSRFRFTVHVAQ